MFSTFDKLLLATGGSPARLPFGDDQIIYFRTLQDYERLRGLAGQVERFAVIGGGFIGSEIAAALALSGKKVTLIFPQEGIGGNIFPRELSLFLNDFYRQNGILVDEYLRTKHPDIYAAGDVAAFYNPALEKLMRVEHEDNANTMGQIAGQAIAGEPSAYHHLPFFYSDLFELGYEAVGELNSRMDIVSDWKEPYREGVVYYLREGRVRGVLLWNVWGKCRRPGV